MPLGDVQIKFDEDGEILIKSEALFCGYHKREEDTREAFTEDGFFKSGDIGEFNEAGYLKITDRITSYNVCYTKLLRTRYARL